MIFGYRISSVASKFVLMTLIDDEWHDIWGFNSYDNLEKVWSILNQDSKLNKKEN